MYVYKMVFLEREELSEKAQEILQQAGIIQTVDYGNTEIQADTIQELYANENYQLTSELLEALSEIPREIVQGLRDNTIDMVQIIY